MGMLLTTVLADEAFQRSALLFILFPLLFITDEGMSVAAVVVSLKD